MPAFVNLFLKKRQFFARQNHLIFVTVYYIMKVNIIAAVAAGKDVIMKATTAGHVVRIIISVLLLLLILSCIVGMVFLGVGVGNANRTGTFNLFGHSFHLNKSNAMEPDISKNELVVVKHMPFSDLAEGDLVAFYVEEDGEEHLLIRRIEVINGITYTVADNEGTTMEISADTCRFLGKATSKSAALGKAVVFLQTEEGRMIFFGWTAGVTVFLLGFTILIHVLWKMIFGKPLKPQGPIDALTGEPLSFDTPVTLSNTSDRE